MQRLALVLALCGCASAQRHPAVAIGIVGVFVGGLACEMNDPAHQSTCGIIAGAAGLGLGGITGLVTLFADTSDHSIPGDEDMEMEGSAVRLHTHTAPPPEPLFLDAGVGSAAVDAGSAAVDAQGAPSSAL
jgi:hypothetical protein